MLEMPILIPNINIYNIKYLLLESALQIKFLLGQIDKGVIGFIMSLLLINFLSCKIDSLHV